ncbi:prepilin-type N-terminal cleavage/methylation domain-containing protein [Sporosarcina sp. BP05]|uniref:prepilin-type N-terminal cleavage/methylation domain-containing protein n=1 Tax=Sporosarcina sp. BP05 TaxID=2758726 RepID=UPI0016453B8A|nr:prepilin-type N-terminal cleavage/methylation domain-containing protein [Sporosarcina sp. BP05]
MLNKFKKQMKNEKGLTLIELLAVIVILAIIAAIAVPAIGNVINNSKDKAILADASNILSGAKIALVDGACTDTSGAISCVVSSDAALPGLQDYVEGMKVGATYSATRTAAGVWTITYNKLDELKTKKYVGYKATAITDAKLTEALNK